MKGIIMQSLTHLSTTELHWNQPNLFKMEYELRQQDEHLARLHFPSGFKALANGDCTDGTWSFERVGVINMKVLVRLPENDTPIATLDYKTHHIELSDGQHYPAKVNFWQTEYTFEVESGLPLLKITSKGVIHPALDVEISPSAASQLPQPSPLPWMILLGWYLVVMAHNDSATVTAATAGIAAAA
jgi:hypothetical protein